MYKDLETRNLIKLPSQNSLKLMSLGKNPIIYINNISQNINNELHVNVRLKIIRGIPENHLRDFIDKKDIKISNIENENESLNRCLNEKKS